MGLAAGAPASPLVERIGGTGPSIRIRVEPSPEDFARALDPESPATTGFLVVVPPGAEPAVRVVEDRAAELSGVPGGPRPLPELPARVAERARAGQFELVRIEVAPVTAAAGGGLVRHDALVVDVDLGPLAVEATAPAPGAARRRTAGGSRVAAPAAGLWEAAAAGPGAVASAVASVVVNGSDVLRFASRPAAPPARSSPPPAGAVRLEVRADGVYRVRHADLAGLPAFATGDPRQFRVLSRGAEIPIEVDGEADGSFDPGDQVVFLARRNRGPITDASVYWLVPPDGTAGIRIPARAAFPAGAERLAARPVVRGVLRLEEQKLFFNRMPAPEGKDAWMSAYLASNGSLAGTFLPTDGSTVDLPDLARPVPGEAYRLRARVVGRASSLTADDQEVVVRVNGLPAVTETWFASTTPDRAIDRSFDPTLLTGTGNSVRIEQPPPADPLAWRVNYVDWLELEYPRRLMASGGRIEFGDRPAAGACWYVEGLSGGPVRIYVEEADGVTRLVGPRVLSLGPGMPATLAFAWDRPATADLGVTVVEPQALRAPDRIVPDVPSSLRAGPGAAYVAIVHPQLLAEAQALVALRGALVVDVTDVYDEFSDGIEDPAAVREFLSWALARWSVPPEHVALIGDASFDPRNHLGLPAAGYDPPSLVHAASVYLDTASDLRAPSDVSLAAAAGSDFLPDVAMGRLPARDPAELRAYLARVAASEAAAPAAWMDRVVLFADDDINNGRTECGVPGAVAADMDVLVARYLPGAAPANLVRRYAGAYTMSFAPQTLRADLLADLAAGAGLLVYAGHGNVFSLGRHCQDGAFPILHDGLAASLANADRLPLGVALTCDAGDFDYAASGPGGAITDSFAEAWIGSPAGGTIGWLASSTVLVYSTGRDLTDALFSVLYAGDPIGSPDNRVLGSVGLGVSLRLFAERGGAARDAVLTLSTLGDPGARLRAGTP